VIEFNWEDIKALGQSYPARLIGNKNLISSASALKQPDSEAELIIIFRSRLGRIFRGGLVFIAGLLVTALSALIPVIHFILVPLCLIVTLVATLFAGMNAKLIAGGQGTCPYCTAKVRIFQRRWTAAFIDRCEACSKQFEVRSLN